MHNLNSSFLKFLDITAYTQPNNTAPKCSLEDTSVIEVSTKIPTKENDRIDRQQVVSTRDSAVNNDVINYVNHDTFEVETISETSTTATKLAELIKNIEANNCAIVLSDDEIELLVILLKKKSLDDLSLEHKITLLEKNQITLAMLPEKIKETDPNKIYQLALNGAIKCITDYSSLLTDKQIIEILQRNYNIYAEQLPEDRVIKLALEYYSTIPELFNKIPNEYKTQEMCNIVCNKNISLLIAVPKHFKTLHLCKLYCQDKNQKQLLFKQKLPDALLHDIELCELALKHNALNIFFISPALVEKNTYLIEICFDLEKQLIKDKNSLGLFNYMYQKYPNLVTLEQFNKAINQTKKINLDNIPVCYLNKKLCLDIIENKLFVEYSTMVNLLNTDIFSKEEWLDLLEKYDQKIGGILISSLISNDNCQALTLQDLDRHTILKICNDEYKQRLFDKLPFEIYKEKKMSEVIAEYQGILMYSYRKLSKYGINIYDNKKTLDIIYSYVIYQGGTFSYDSVMKCQNCDKDEDKAKAKEILFQFYMNHPEHLIKADFSDEFFIELVNHFTKLLSNNSLFSPINIVSCISYKIKTITNKKLFEAIVNNLTIFCAMSFTNFKKLVTEIYIPEDIKLAIYDQILNKGFSSPIKNAKSLYDKTYNPLSFKISDTTFLKVLQVCFKAAKTERLDNRVALALKSSNENNKISSLPLINDYYLNVLQHEPLDICGGRTAKTISSNDDKCLNFKFQRDDETLKELTDETITLDFLNQHPDAKELKARAESEIPITTFNCRVPYENVAHIINKFDDTVTIFTDNDDREYVNLICFETSANYSIYAHVLDTNSPKPLKTTIQGIYKTSHDLAMYASYNILYTNTLPAWHDAGREWKILHCLFGYPTCSVVGSLKAWRESTERVDFGWTGLRDLGDFFLNIKNSIRSKFTSNHSQFASVEQHILTANTIAEQLLAAILVMAKAYSQLPNYHYEDPKAIVDMKRFVIGLLNVYRKSYLNTDTKESLAEFMQLNKAELEEWLDHMVVRLIYMTAKQPTFINSVPQLSDLDNEEKERLANSYSVHLNLNGELNKKLYPDSSIFFKILKFPKDFEGDSKDSNNGKIGLGKKNGTFAVPSLITGLMNFTAELIERKYS